MLEVIKGILKKVAGMVVESKGPYRTYNAKGRPNEELRGKFIQHYGFASSPTAGTESVVLEYGNNSISIAENPGKIDSKGLLEILKPGEVLVYSPDNDLGSFIMIQNPCMGCKNGNLAVFSGNVDITAFGKDDNEEDGTINVESLHKDVIVKANRYVLLQATGISLSDTGAGLDYLLKASAGNTYNDHTHVIPSPPVGVVGPPVYKDPPNLPALILPIDVTTVVMAE